MRFALPKRGLLAAATAAAALAASPAPAAPPTHNQVSIYFDPGSERLTEVPIKIVRTIALLYARHAQAKADHALLVEGHADRSEPGSKKFRLSCRRAAAVRAALIEAGVPAERIVTGAAGTDAPQATTNDARGRAMNRRVLVEFGALPTTVAAGPPLRGVQACPPSRT